VLGGCFGKMTMKYTRNYVWNSLLQVRERYEVVATDEGSLFSAEVGTIVLRVHCDNTTRMLSGTCGATVGEFFKPSLLHIHFVESRGRQYYWIGAWGFCEWFMKMR
jgi:hypothetical protein